MNAGPQDRYIAPEMKDYTPIYRFGHHLLLPTRIGDGPPKLFLLATGSVLNLISPEAARSVTKVSRDYDITVKGLSGKVNKVFTADKLVLQFSHYKQENQEMTGFDFSRQSNGAGIEESGILGYLTLHLFEVLIDYRDGLVDFHYDPSRLP